MGKYLEHRILENPRSISTEIVQPAKGAIIMTANDEFFIESKSAQSGADISVGAVLFICGIFIFFHEDNVGFNFKKWGSFNFFNLVFLIPGFYLIIQGLFKPKKHMQLYFNRLEGIISYPGLFFEKPLKGPFNKLKTMISVSGDIDGYSPTEYLKVINTFRPRIIDGVKTITYKNPKNEWSLYVWYMDKNRPLPPGTAFDPYRQKDFERRKAAKFPKPLYPSNIPTPEATPEQQKERNKIGGW